MYRPACCLLAALVLGPSFSTLAMAADGAEKGPESTAAAAQNATAQTTGGSTTSAPASSGKTEGTPSSTPSKYPPFAEVVKEATQVDGLIRMHHKGTRLYAELNSSHFDHDFIVLISIARGIGKGQILGGMSWGTGDDGVWQFRRIDDRVQVVRRNVRFTAQKGKPRREGR